MEENKKIENENLISNANDIEIDSEYISRTIEEVIKNKDVIILDSMGYQQRMKVYSILSHVPEVTYFTIGFGENKKIVLKYIIPYAEKLDLRQALADYRADFEEGKYENCIEELKQIIYTVDKPKSFVYYSLGICYFKIQDNENAIKYLEIFQKINEESSEYKKDAKKLISYLKWVLTRDDYKSAAKLDISEFKENADDKYNIDNLEKMKNIILHSGFTVEEVCVEFGVAEKDIPLMRLIIAKELYLHGKEHMADKIVRVIGKEKNKNIAVKNLLSEIIANKKLYMSKKIEESAPIFYIDKRDKEKEESAHQLSLIKLK